MHVLYLSDIQIILFFTIQLGERWYCQLKLVTFGIGGEATNTNFIVFGLTRRGLEPTIYRTRGEHANHYTTDVLSQ